MCYASNVKLFGIKNSYTKCSCRTHWLNIQRPFASIELTLSSIHLLRLPREIRDQVKNTSSLGMHNEALRVFSAHFLVQYPAHL